MMLPEAWVVIVSELPDDDDDAAGMISAGASMTTTLATTSAATGIAYATASCPYSQYYTLVMQPDGTYKKVGWTGKPGDLPPRAKA